MELTLNLFSNSGSLYAFFNSSISAAVRSPATDAIKVKEMIIKTVFILKMSRSTDYLFATEKTVCDFWENFLSGILCFPFECFNMLMIAKRVYDCILAKLLKNKMLNIFYL